MFKAAFLRTDVQILDWVRNHSFFFYFGRGRGGGFRLNVQVEDCLLEASNYKRYTCSNYYKMER